jgi:aryl-alcohol dehydrogenase-like predicted oxidoreductase
MKLALGTVQFGLPYGVANQQGQVTEDEATKILKYAKESNIDTLDTAIGYGDSEQCLGDVGVENWEIITKLPVIPKDCEDVDEWIKNEFSESLKRLKIKRIKGLMLHQPIQLLESIGDRIWSTLQTLKQSGLVEKVGFSIYEPQELKQLWTDFQPDIVQAPFNVLDQRLKISGWLEKLHNNNVEVHVRSIFLQGLLLMKKDSRPEKFIQWNTIWKVWDSWLEEVKMSPLEASLGFVNSESMIDRNVVGVDSLKQLKEIIACSDLQIKDIPIEITTTDQNLINPSNWRKL